MGKATEDDGSHRKVARQDVVTLLFPFPLSVFLHCLAFLRWNKLTYYS